MSTITSTTQASFLIEPLLVPINEASRLLSVSPSTIRRLVAKRVLRSVKAQDRLLFPLAELRRFVNAPNGSNPEGVHGVA